jgi:hypothetical protein
MRKSNCQGEEETAPAWGQAGAARYASVPKNVRHTHLLTRGQFLVTYSSELRYLDSRTRLRTALMLALSTSASGQTIWKLQP